MVWLAEPKVVEENLVQAVVVILTRMNQNLIEVDVASLDRHCHLDDFRPRSHNGCDLQLVYHVVFTFGSGDNALCARQSTVAFRESAWDTG
mgnify:CR=1 FL=1